MRWSNAQTDAYIHDQQYSHCSTLTSSLPSVSFHHRTRNTYTHLSFTCDTIAYNLVVTIITDAFINVYTTRKLTHERPIHMVRGGLGDMGPKYQNKKKPVILHRIYFHSLSSFHFNSTNFNILALSGYTLGYTMVDGVDDGIQWGRHNTAVK